MNLLCRNQVFQDSGFNIRKKKGSIIALTDESGAIKTQYSYSPFGLTREIGEASGNPFKFTGREHDETGLYYYRARYYSPEMGRFLAEDPIRFAGGDVNFYAYVRNRPLNLVDPLGLWYIDLNISVGLPNFVGVTGGLIIDTETGDLRTYGGGGIVTPGLSGSITGSSSDPSTGWTVGLQGVLGIAGQLGYGFGENGGWFGELGGGLPYGLSLTGYYISDPLLGNQPNTRLETARCH